MPYRVVERNDKFCVEKTPTGEEMVVTIVMTKLMHK